ncbi:MAG: TPR end-of-group domain-containing protein [Bacteroidales bacterium]
MKKQYLFIIGLIIIISCSSKPNPKELFLKRFKKGSIIDKVECKSTGDQSYCLYMPSAYDINKTFPVIYAFDPHGDGRIPVELLKDIAEKLHYVVIGSNNVRNGLSTDDINYSVSQLLFDTKTKLAIDTTRIYLVGFSGGARIASSLAQSLQGVKGVIACSAGFETTSAPSYPFIGISSTGDMNYLEMKKLNASLQKLNANTQLILFDGKHEWPPKAVMEEAVSILELNAMKANIIPQNKNIIDEFQNVNTEKANKLIACNNIDSLLKAYNILSRNITVMDKLTDISKQKTMVTSIAQKPELLKYFKDEAILEAYENQKQQEFVAAFENKQDAWWNTELKKLDNDSKDQNILKSNTAKRLKGYISLSCYSYSYRALQNQDWKYASLFTHIYQKVDPENPDCYYALACLYANTNQKEQAIASLQTAIKFGFSNKNKLQNDVLLNPLHDMPEFEKILTGM